VHQALTTLGFGGLHWVNPLTGRLPGEVDLHLFDAFSDINIAAQFETLAERYPASRFIWTQRPVEAWVRSVSAHYEQRNGVRSPGELRYRRHSGHFEGQSGEIHESLFAGHSSWADAYAAFDSRVECYFGALPHDRLLRLSITEGDGWEVLCPFLGCEEPVASFPYANAGTALSDSGAVKKSG
ncbi:MAG: sulfotransferase, partial [Acidimicrobiales bacterium]|nr:sulfotransferase [Acidimicrobiales bacterium]